MPRISIAERYRRLVAKRDAEWSRLPVKEPRDAPIFRVVEIDLQLRTRNEVGRFTDRFSAHRLANEMVDGRVRAVVMGKEFISGTSRNELSNDDWNVVREIVISI